MKQTSEKENIEINLYIYVIQNSDKSVFNQIVNRLISSLSN